MSGRDRLYIFKFSNSRIFKLNSQSCEKDGSYQRLAGKLWEIYIPGDFYKPEAGCTFTVQIQVAMSTSRLHDDLLQGFHEEKKLIQEQLDIFDPLAVSLRKPVAQRLLSKGLLIFYEILCYLLGIVMILLIVFMNRIYPFHLLHVLRSRDEFTDRLGIAEMNNLFLCVAGLVVIIAVLFFILARIVRRVRLKNDILNLAGKHMKTLVGQHLKRKAVLDSIEQRNFQELPGEDPIPPDVDEHPDWRRDV